MTATSLAIKQLSRVNKALPQFLHSTDSLIVCCGAEKDGLRVSSSHQHKLTQRPQLSAFANFDRIDLLCVQFSRSGALINHPLFVLGHQVDAHDSACLQFSYNSLLDPPEWKSTCPL